MSTRSRIGIVNSDKTVSSIYCHFDGYPEGVGQTLLNHFTTKHQVQKLIDLGDISSLRRSTEAPAGHSFANAMPECTVAYGRDRGETNTEAITMDSLQYFFEIDFEEFGYIFDPVATRWIFKSQYHSDQTVRDLADVLESINKV
jgi:hypothetical protein|tara:strand:- start:301 stop:732 length:432 start_codon:yes stop_codon:yes gene_type:complete